MTDLPVDEARAFAKAFVDLSQLAHRVLLSRNDELTARLRTHLGLADGEVVTSTSVSWPVVERANLQRALDELAATRRWQVVGLSGDVGHYGGASAAAMVSGSWDGPGEGAPQYEEVDVGLDDVLPCLKAGLVLSEHDGVPVVALVHTKQHDYPPVLVVDAVGGDATAAQGFLAEVRRLMDVHNVFRGQVIAFSHNIHGDFGIRFTRVTEVTADQVVLGDGDLAAIEEHAIGISEHAAGLRELGQHVKRGLLLYGPPGTGKSHTISYLLGRMAGRTTIILSGPAVAAIGQAGSIARQLQPATIVIEDVDLIGMDRGLPGGEHNPLLFQLLNEMDGLAEDADVLFVLTTNRVDILEPALAARPGRIDQAIEIGLPESAARRRLFALYTDVEDEAVLERVVERTAGVAPAFIKELGRRAALTHLRTGRPAAESLELALTAMLAHATPILRRSLAAADEGGGGSWAPHPAAFDEY